MSLDDLQDAVERADADLESLSVDLDQESRTELALLVAALDPEDAGDLVRRGVHLLFDDATRSGKLDFHLRSTYDTTYDEFLAGMSYEEMTGQQAYTQQDENERRRYQY